MDVTLVCMGQLWGDSLEITEKKGKKTKTTQTESTEQRAHKRESRPPHKVSAKIRKKRKRHTHTELQSLSERGLCNNMINSLSGISVASDYILPPSSYYSCPSFLPLSLIRPWNIPEDLVSSLVLFKDKLCFHLSFCNQAMCAFYHV